MKTSWVLTEDDKTRLGARQGDRDQEHETLNIKTEQAEDAVDNVKPRSPSPMSFRGTGGNYFPLGGFSHHHDPHSYTGQQECHLGVLHVFCV